MAIPVLCAGCGSRFTVSDKFAGKTGPCPKCKKPIVIPASAVQAVTIHEPEPVTAAGPAGHASTIPFRRVETPIPGVAWAGIGGGVVVAMLAAWLTGFVFRPGTPPEWLLLTAALLLAVPCVLGGYVAVRERELEPHRGRALWLRAVVCAAVYAGLWAVKGMLPAEATAEMWQWIYLGPLFVLPGALAALATLDLDWGAAVAHFSFYVLFTSLLRWLAGLPPL
ncbi:hypothetical protein EBR04_07925 [bacterium]|nr:hypothetical protein [bacterium]